jgi:hypothetical protein
MISFLYYYLDIETLSPTSTSLAVIWFRSMRGLRGPNAAKTKSIAMRDVVGIMLSFMSFLSQPSEIDCSNRYRYISYCHLLFEKDD